MLGIESGGAVDAFYEKRFYSVKLRVGQALASTATTSISERSKPSSILSRSSRRSTQACSTGGKFSGRSRLTIETQVH